MPKFTSADIEIKAKDKTKAGVKSAKKGIGGLTAAVKNYGAEMAAVYLLVKKVISVVKGLTDAYANQEVAETKLRSALAATGQLTYATEQALHSFASEMQSATGISDNLTISAAGIMTTFTQISTETFPEAIEAAANMSIMLGRDLQGSVIQLGKALNDPIIGVGALREAGISFSEEQKKSIKLFMDQNDIMSAQRVILDELNLELGGVARAYGKTLAGQQDIVNQEFSAFKELLGSIIATNLPGYLAMASDLIDSFSNLVEKVFAARLEIIRFKKIIGAMTIKELKDAKEATDELAMANIREDQALVKLIASGKLNRRETKAAVKALAELHIVFNNLQAEIDEYDKLIEKAEEAQRKFNETVEDGIEPIKEIGEAIKDTGEAIKTLTENLIAARKSREKLHKEEMESLAEEAETTEETVAVMTSSYSSYWEFKKKLHDKEMKQSEEKIEALEKEKEAAEELFEEALAQAQFFLDQVEGMYDAYFNMKLQGIDNEIMKEQERIDALDEIYATDLQNLQDRFDEGLIDEATYDDAVDELDKNLAKSKGDTMDSLEEERKGILTEQAKAEKKTAIFSAIIDTASAVLKSLAAYPWPWNLIPAGIALGLGLAQIKFIESTPIPTFAEGGIVTEPTVALLGEKGPEAVIPLDRRREKQEMMMVNVYLGTRKIYSELTKAITNRDVMLDARSLTHKEYI